MRTARLAILYTSAASLAMAGSVAALILTNTEALAIPPFILGIGIITYGLIHTTTGEHP